MSLHESFRKMLEEANREASKEDEDAIVEDIVRKHLEEALKKAGKEIEATFDIGNVVVSISIREVCVYAKRED